jgi:hypothetical protein
MDEARSIEELEASARSADDKERLVGLLGAPFAAAIGLLIIDALITNDPPALLKNGQVNRLHVSTSLYHELLIVLVVLSVAILVTAFFRKRLYLGIAMASYGLAVFNLHYWGFGIPYLLAGSWYLVRAYRIQRDLREATGDVRGGARGTTGPPLSSGRRLLSRYTRPVGPRR